MAEISRYDKYRRNACVKCRAKLDDPMAQWTNARHKDSTLVNPSDCTALYRDEWGESESARADAAEKRVLNLRQNLAGLQARHSQTEAYAQKCQDRADALQQQVDALQSRLDVLCEPGTPIAIVNGMFNFAEKECGHHPTFACHALTTIIGWIANAKRQVETLEANAKSISEEMERCHKRIDEAQGVDPETTSIEPLEHRVAALLEEITEHNASFDLRWKERLDWLSGINHDEWLRLAVQSCGFRQAIDAAMAEARAGEGGE